MKLFQDVQWKRYLLSIAESFIFFVFNFNQTASLILSHIQLHGSFNVIYYLLCMTGQFPEACARTSSHTTSKSNNLVQKLQKVFVALTFMSHANADASYFRLWCICKPARIAVPETELKLGFDALGILR